MRQHSPKTIPHPDCCGYLNKQHERATELTFMNNWSKRYCVLKDAVLFFYDGVESHRAFGCVCLHGLKVIGNTTKASGRKHSFELASGNDRDTYHIFAADSDLDKKR